MKLSLTGLLGMITWEICTIKVKQGENVAHGSSLELHYNDEVMVCANVKSSKTHTYQWVK